MSTKNSIERAQLQKLVHSPTLNTVHMVEATLKNMDRSVITIAELKKILPKKVNHRTLKIILEYLDESNKIKISIKGISWVHPHPHKSLRKHVHETSIY